ncbi:hypothetical protein HD806DRAFT_383259 [Xylariaceae sp. AK1471]|nr:hypothetical protein HD806DRAFT_383259 [Xylariaceae sp. AK1471]
MIPALILFLSMGEKLVMCFVLPNLPFHSEEIQTNKNRSWHVIRLPGNKGQGTTLFQIGRYCVQYLLYVHLKCIVGSWVVLISGSVNR